MEITVPAPRSEVIAFLQRSPLRPEDLSLLTLREREVQPDPFEPYPTRAEPVMETVIWIADAVAAGIMYDAGKTLLVYLVEIIREKYGADNPDDTHGDDEQ